MIRESLWQKLDTETQKALKSAVDEMLERNYQEAPSNSDRMLMKLVTQHKTIYNPDLAPFQEALGPLYNEFGKSTGTTEIIKEIGTIK